MTDAQSAVSSNEEERGQLSHLARLALLAAGGAAAVVTLTGAASANAAVAGGAAGAHAGTARPVAASDNARAFVANEASAVVQAAEPYLDLEPYLDWSNGHDIM